MDTTEELSGYFFAGMHNLSPGELFFWITVEETMKQLGVDDIGAVIAILSGQNILTTRQKLKGAIEGTSLASVYSRKILPYKLNYKILPTLVGTPVKGLRIVLVNNLGTFVGRAVPIEGWVIIAYDVSIISYKSVNKLCQKQ